MKNRRNNIISKIISCIVLAGFAVTSLPAGPLCAQDSLCRPLASCKAFKEMAGHVKLETISTIIPDFSSPAKGEQAKFGIILVR